MRTRHSILCSDCRKKYSQSYERESWEGWEGCERAVWRSEPEWWRLRALDKLEPVRRTNEQILAFLELLSEPKVNLKILLRLIAGQCILPLSCLQSMQWPNDHTIANMTMISGTWDVTIIVIAAMYWKNCSSLNGQFNVSSSHLRSPQICYSTIQCVVCHHLPPFVILTKWFLLFLCFMDIKSHHQADSRSLGDTYNTLQLWLGLIIFIFCSFWSWNNNFAK